MLPPSRLPTTAPAMDPGDKTWLRETMTVLDRSMVGMMNTFGVSQSRRVMDRGCSREAKVDFLLSILADQLIPVA